MWTLVRFFEPWVGMTLTSGSTRRFTDLDIPIPPSHQAFSLQRLRNRLEAFSLHRDPSIVPRSFLHMHLLVRGFAYVCIF